MLFCNTLIVAGSRLDYVLNWLTRLQQLIKTKQTFGLTAPRLSGYIGTTLWGENPIGSGDGSWLRGLSVPFTGAGRVGFSSSRRKELHEAAKRRCVETRRRVRGARRLRSGMGVAGGASKLRSSGQQPGGGNCRAA